MSRKRLIVGSVAVAMAVVMNSWAVVPSEQTFRTTSVFEGVYQRTNSAGAFKIELTSLEGHDLVNLTLGTPLSTVRTNEVLAIEIAPDSSQFNLMVYDKATESNIATIGISTQVTRVVEETSTNASPFRERFIAQVTLVTTNSLLGGQLTLAGRLHLNPSNGAPTAVLVDTDRSLDRLFGDQFVANMDDVDPDVHIAGYGHMIGTMTVIGNGGSTNNVLIPWGRMTIRRLLATP